MMENSVHQARWLLAAPFALYGLVTIVALLAS